MVRDDNRIAVLDFDWAGKVNEACYPYFLNNLDIAWPDGASDGLLITKEHDKYWMEEYFSYLVEFEL